MAKAPANSSRLQTTPPPPELSMSPRLPRRPSRVNASAMEPVTSSSTRLRPVRAQTDPQMIAAVQTAISTASRITTARMELSTSSSAEKSPMNEAANDPAAKSSRVKITPSAPKTNPSTAAVTTEPGFAGCAEPYCP
jgi:hypothetical protein